MKICAATGNAGKLRELRRILEAQGHEVVSQKELGITLEPEETGTTFAANALIKAQTICKASGLPTIADDSGLCVEALGGAPGVYSARYCGHHGDDQLGVQPAEAVAQRVPGERGRVGAVDGRVDLRDRADHHERHHRHDPHADEEFDHREAVVTLARTPALSVAYAQGHVIVQVKL